MPKCYSLGMETLREAVRLARAETGVSLATVIRIVGSAPRHPGAKMLVLADGSIFGTIGGGQVEQAVRNVGAEIASGGPAQRVRYHLDRDLAMCCGGGMEFYVEPVAPSIAALEMAVDLLAQRKSVRLVTRFDGGGKTAEPHTGDRGDALALEEDSFVESLWPRDRVLLFGLGHVGRAVGPLLAGVGFDVVVCDDNETDALSEYPEWASEVVESFDLPDVEREAGPFGPSDFAVIATREHALDQRVLEGLLPREELGYLGMIGSRRKVARFRERLVAKGVADDRRWARLHAPIGLDIGGETPAEIALAIAAEVVKVRNRGNS